MYDVHAKLRLVTKVPPMAIKKLRKRRGTAGKRRRDSLTRERVVAEARRLLNQEGLLALSMRVLAKRLGVSTMALYNHVRDKRDLMEGIAQAVVEELRLPAATGDWQERVTAIFRALRRVCLANPHAMPVIERAEVLPAIFRPMEAALAALRDADIGLQEGMRAYFLLTNFTLGQVSYEIRGPFRGIDPAEAVRGRTIDTTEFPLVVKATSAGVWDFDAAFEFGLETIMAGLAARSRRTLPSSKARVRRP